MKKILLLLTIFIISSCSIETKLDRKENLKSVVRATGAIGTVTIIHKSVTKIADDCKSCK